MFSRGSNDERLDDQALPSQVANTGVWIGPRLSQRSIELLTPGWWPIDVLNSPTLNHLGSVRFTVLVANPLEGRDSFNGYLCDFFTEGREILAANETSTQFSAHNFLAAVFVRKIQFELSFDNDDYFKLWLIASRDSPAYRIACFWRGSSSGDKFAALNPPAEVNHALALRVTPSEPSYSPDHVVSVKDGKFTYTPSKLANRHPERFILLAAYNSVKLKAAFQVTMNVPFKKDAGTARQPRIIYGCPIGWLSLPCAGCAPSVVARCMSTMASLPVNRQSSLQPASLEPDPVMQFRDVSWLYQILDSFSGDFLIVTDVSAHDFSQIEAERERRHRKIRFRRYHSDTSVLIITIPTALHEALHLEIYRRFEHQIYVRGLQNSWRPIGSATFRAQGHPAGDGGEGDSSGGPRLGRPSKGTWPKLVIEAGDSESMQGLHDDMFWWFSRSNHEVKIVLLAKFEHRQKMIVLERWQEELQPARPGTISTRLAPDVLEPRLQQRMTITQNLNNNPVSYDVARGALVLSGRLLFGSQVGDFVFSVNELEEYARSVWEVV